MVTCQVKIGKICVKSIIMVIIKKENEKDKKIKLVDVQTQKFGVDLETLKNKKRIKDNILCIFWWWNKILW